jgi:hypothetical protein
VPVDVPVVLPVVVVPVEVVVVPVDPVVPAVVTGGGTTCALTEVSPKKKQRVSKNTVNAINVDLVAPVIISKSNYKANCCRCGKIF